MHFHSQEGLPEFCKEKDHNIYHLMPTVLWFDFIWFDLVSFTSQIRNHLNEKRPEQKAESLYFPFYTFSNCFART